MAQATPADEAAETAAPGGVARLMHAASQPAMLGTTGASSPAAVDRGGGGGGEGGGGRSAQRQSAAETPSHAAEPPALRSYNLRRETL